MNKTLFESGRFRKNRQKKEGKKAGAGTAEQEAGQAIQTSAGTETRPVRETEGECNYGSAGGSATEKEWSYPPAEDGGPEVKGTTALPGEAQPETVGINKRDK